jgi:FMN phosphatase YigB (HAD superfamily)
VPVRAVWFDIGETLIDESDIFGAWADHLGVPRLTFSAVFGAVIARGLSHREVFDHFWPGFDFNSVRLDRGVSDHLVDEDLYPDALRSLQALQDAGYFVGIAGNQPVEAGPELRKMDLPCDVLATSAEWDLEKPSAAFFDKVTALSGCDRDQIAYVGDRLDNDVIPAAAAGLISIWIRRGPWGHILGPESVTLPAGVPAMTVNSLDELARNLTTDRP